jgi:cell cycle arrest protein BUB3
MSAGNPSLSRGLQELMQNVRIDVETATQTVLSSHTAGVRSIAYSSTHKLLISASWDSTLHIHRTGANPGVVTRLELPSKPFSLSLSPSKLVVAMAARALHIYELSALASLAAKAPSSPASTTVPLTSTLEPWQRRESSLKFMTRAVACMPDDSGYASSSIEGRVAVEWFDADEASQARKYAFKCHRQPGADGVDVVYPVNALAFHPGFGTFASSGGDGFVALWDASAKRRIRQYQRYPASVAALAFSADGRYLAVGVSPGCEDGKDEEATDPEGVVKVFVRELAEGEAKGKGAK